MFLPTCFQISDKCVDVQNLALRDGRWEPVGRTTGEGGWCSSERFRARDSLGKAL